VVTTLGCCVRGGRLCWLLLQCRTNTRTCWMDRQ
jgi:hypothetical protein